MKLIFSWIDGLVLLLSVALIYALPSLQASSGCYPVILVEPFIMCYWLFRILFALSRKWTSVALIVALVAFCGWEVIIGYSQLLENLGSKKGQEICVGSFTNSGPFACFLSVCSCLFIAIGSKVSWKAIKCFFVILAALAFILMVCTLSRASLLAFAVSMMFLAMKKEYVASFIKKNWVYLSLSVLLIGAGAYAVKKPSADGRMLMARIGLRIMKENGIKGAGLGNYAAEYGKAQADFFAGYLDDGSDGLNIDNVPENLRMVADCPTYAFNEYLKMGIEAGPVAMVLLIGLVIAGVVCSYKEGSCWCYPLISIAVFSCFSYPFDVAILLMLFVVFLASVRAGNCNGVGNMVLYAMMIVVLIPHYYIVKTDAKRMQIATPRDGMEQFCGNRPKRFFVIGRDMLDDGVYDDNLLFSIGQAVSRNGDYSKSDVYLRVGTEISSDPMFWNIIGNNYFAQADYNEAEACYKHAFYMVPNRLYPLYLLAKMYHAEGDTARFLDMTAKAERFKAKVESENTERLRKELVSIKERYYE
ncbi:MAG: hypothetical protein IK039_01235 [Bacteroidaceae bacterium]|nr:hypothetical protein [Bacteroidaceae bacterium]